MINIDRLKLIIFSSILGNVGGDIRALSFDYTNDKITMYGYLDREPCDDDYESIDIIITEIMSSCSNFIKQDIKLIESHEPIGMLNSYKGWVFVRKE